MNLEDNLLTTSKQERFLTNNFKKKLFLFVNVSNTPIFAPPFGNAWQKDTFRVDFVAQPVEHLTFNQRVPGSNPGEITKSSRLLFTELTGGFF